MSDSALEILSTAFHERAIILELRGAPYRLAEVEFFSGAASALQLCGHPEAANIWRYCTFLVRGPHMPDYETPEEQR